MDAQCFDVPLGAPESWRLLELAAINDVILDDHVVDLDSVIAGVDWDQVMLAAIKHRLTPRLADFLIRSKRLSLVPQEWRQVLVYGLHENRHKTALKTREASRVISALAENGVAVACTKGVTFQSSLYDGFGGRAFRDIDLMIHEESRDQVAEVLLEIGYRANMTHDLDTDRILSLPRRELAMFKLYPDHLPHFLRPLTGQAIPYFVVDVCFNITWFRAAWQIPMREVLAEVRQVRVTAFDETVDLPALAAPYDFIFTAMHLFREGWFEWMATHKHLRLGQFADLWRQWQRLDPADAATLAELVAKHEIGPPIAWASHHVDQIFGSSITTGLGLEDFCDDVWLHSASAVDGSYLSWTGSMRDRIRPGEPPKLVPGPEPRFAADARAGR